MMNQRDYFVLGSKLIGLYCLILALPVFLQNVFSLFSHSRYTGETNLDLILAFISVFTPLLVVILGVYLLKSGSMIHEMAFPATRADSDNMMASYFEVGIKLYGVYMIIGSLPGLSRRLSNYLWVGDPTDPYNVRVGVAEGLGMDTDFWPVLINIVIGIYLLVIGQSLIRFAFPEVAKEAN